MARFPARVVLGRSGLSVGPLGIAGGYGIGKEALFHAFDCGANYWYHGSRRAAGMTAAIKELVKAGHSDELVIVLQSYSRWASLLERTFERGLKNTGLDYADVLLLGLYNSPPNQRVLERALRMQERGMFHHLAISAHRRPRFVEYASDLKYSVLHVRYSAAHVGAEDDVFPYLAESGRPGMVAYTATRWGTLLKERRMPPGERPLRGRDCYRFVLSNPNFNVCMAGPKNPEELEEALAALDEGPLTNEEDERIRRIGRFVHDHSRWPY